MRTSLAGGMMARVALAGLPVAAATANARAAGLDDRVRFELRDVNQGVPGSYDLITLFDVVHDAPHPVQLLSGWLEP